MNNGESVWLCLPGNKRTLVEASDLPMLDKLRWRAKSRYGGPGYGMWIISTPRDENGRERTILMHRYLLGAKPNEVVDHINGDTLDNRRSNLRVTDRRGNSTNVRSSKNQKLGRFKGVTWHKKNRKWQAQIGGGDINPKTGKRRTICLGLFDDPADAARAYDAAAVRCFGEFAAPNFPTNKPTVTP